MIPSQPLQAGLKSPSSAGLPHCTGAFLFHQGVYVSGFSLWPLLGLGSVRTPSGKTVVEAACRMLRMLQGYDY